MIEFQMLESITIINTVARQIPNVWIPNSAKIRTRHRSNFSTKLTIFKKIIKRSRLVWILALLIDTFLNCNQLFEYRTSLVFRRLLKNCFINIIQML